MGERRGGEPPTRRLDLRGERCPYTTLWTRRALDEISAETVLEVISDYYPARQTIPRLVTELGYDLEAIDLEQPVFRFRIRKRRSDSNEKGP